MKVRSASGLVLLKAWPRQRGCRRTARQLRRRECGVAFRGGPASSCTSLASWSSALYLGKDLGNRPKWLALSRVPVHSGSTILQTMPASLLPRQLPRDEFSFRLQTEQVFNFGTYLSPVDNCQLCQ
jgi:hypothetical protein